MTNFSHSFNKRLHGFEAYDKITMEVVPRYKTSGLSGDEWRTSIWIRFWFKGHVVHETSSNTMENAILRLGSEFITHHEPIAEKVIQLEKKYCDQPGCESLASARFRLKQEFCSEGKGHDPTFGLWRQFCDKHLERGDCGLDDADRNYEPMDGKTAADSTNTEESPSIFGGVIDLRSKPE